MERLTQGEITEYLGYSKHAAEGPNSGNSRNGTASKIAQAGNGDIEIKLPKDRNSEFEPILIGKHKKGYSF